MKTPEEIIENINRQENFAHTKLIQSFEQPNLGKAGISALKITIAKYQYALDVAKKDKERIVRDRLPAYEYKVSLAIYENGVSRFEKTIESLKKLLPKES